MIIHPRLPKPFYTAGGVTFNGSSNYMTKASSVASTTTGKILLSGWYIPAGDSGTKCLWHGYNGSKYVLLQRVGAKFVFSVFTDAGGNKLFSITTAADYTYGFCYNIIVSVDTEFSAGNKLGQICVNGVVDTVVSSDIAASFTLDHSGFGHWGVASAADVPGTFLYAGDMAEFYFNVGTRLDLSVLANKRKFISATGRPVYLGANGNRVTGSQPPVYFKGTGTGFNVNSGSGGNFTITGTVASAVDTPSSINLPARDFVQYGGKFIANSNGKLLVKP